eukprot:12539585-Ditylum_brightwellii.AAC.1
MSGYHQVSLMMVVSAALDNLTMAAISKKETMGELAMVNKTLSESNCSLTDQVTKLQESYTKFDSMMKE